MVIEQLSQKELYLLQESLIYRRIQLNSLLSTSTQFPLLYKEEIEEVDLMLKKLEKEIFNIFNGGRNDSTGSNVPSNRN